MLVCSCGVGPCVCVCVCMCVCVSPAMCHLSGYMLIPVRALCRSVLNHGLCRLIHLMIYSNLLEVVLYEFLMCDVFSLGSVQTLYINSVYSQEVLLVKWTFQVFGCETGVLFMGY